MEKDKIDILLATYNGEKYLKEQIESILNQSYTNIRLIISDDCSTDSTEKIIKEYEKKDNRVKVYVQKENLGYIGNFEFLLKQVENEYYMLSDQDDVWNKDKVKESIKLLKQQNADIVFGDLEIVDKNLNTIKESFGDYMILNNKIKKCIDSYRLNYLYNCVTGCTILSKKEFLKYIIPIPKESKYMVHDYWITIMILANGGKAAYLTKKLIKYRQHGNNQIGIEKISHKYRKFEQVRNLFIDVKLGIFKTYVNNNDRFPTEMQRLNIKSLKYFEYIKNKKYFNFKGWKTFHELYKNEKIDFYIINFIVFNMPFFGKLLFNIKILCFKNT